MPRPRLLVVNQYYTPAFEATAQLLTQLCEALAVDYQVTVVTGVVEGTRPGREVLNGVEVIRVFSTAYERRRLALRATNYLTYSVSSIWKLLTGSRPDVVICMSDPPFVADLAYFAARRARAPYIVISQDVFPEIAVELGRLTNPVLVRILAGMIGFAMRRADRVVAIGETMRRRLVEKGIGPERIAVILNWVDTRELRPLPKRNDWARTHGLEDSFVVMHSGNVGYAQSLDTLVRASTLLSDLDRLRFVVIGTGARHFHLVALAERLAAGRFLFLPFEPRSLLSQSLSAADVHFVGLGTGLSGFIVPSRLNGVLAVARPVIVAADADSEITHVVERIGCGVSLPPGRADLLAAAIRDAYEGRLDLEEMGKRGREYAMREVDSLVSLARYKRLVREVLERPAVAE